MPLDVGRIDGGPPEAPCIGRHLLTFTADYLGKHPHLLAGSMGSTLRNDGTWDAWVMSKPDADEGRLCAVVWALSRDAAVLSAIELLTRHTDTNGTPV